MAVPPFLMLQDPLGDRPDLRDRQGDPVADFAVPLNLPFFRNGQRPFLKQDFIRHPHLAQIVIFRQQTNIIDPVGGKSGCFRQAYTHFLHPESVPVGDMIPFFQQPHHRLDDRRPNLRTPSALFPVHVAVRLPEQPGQIHLAVLADRHTDRHAQ